MFINLEMSFHFWSSLSPVCSSEFHALPCHIHFLAFVSCFLHQLMLLNCCFVPAARAGHSRRRQEEWCGFSHNWLCFDSDGIWQSGNWLRCHCAHQLFIASGGGGHTLTRVEGRRSWSNQGQRICGYVRMEFEGHAKNQVFKILAEAQQLCGLILSHSFNSSRTERS